MQNILCNVRKDRVWIIVFPASTMFNNGRGMCSGVQKGWERWGEEVRLEGGGIWCGGRVWEQGGTSFGGILQATGDVGDSGNGPWMTLMALMDGNMVYLRQWCISPSCGYIRCGNWWYLIFYGMWGDPFFEERVFLRGGLDVRDGWETECCQPLLSIHGQKVLFVCFNVWKNRINK